MEPVDRGQRFPVVVDYAHTDGALRAALHAMRGSTEGRLIVVFGCGGDRDRGKRPLMGRVAGELADYAILTSDNPRSEDPLAILGAVEEGIAAVAGAQLEVVPDRRHRDPARRRAAPPPAAAVLIAGKGHERVQLVKGERLPFVDSDQAARAIEEILGPTDGRGSSRGGGLLRDAAEAMDGRLVMAGGESASPAPPSTRARCARASSSSRCAAPGPTATASSPRRSSAAPPRP